MNHLLFQHRIDLELNEIEQKGRLRSLKQQSDGLCNVSSNDYLCLSRNTEVLEAGILAAKKFGIGGQSSRLVTGNSLIVEQLEAELATWLDYESALIFPSGYQLNHSVLKLLGDENTVFFIDKLAHNSLITGALDSKAEMHRFKHNDLKHLESLLIQHKDEEKTKWIVIETIYSMDGDLAPIQGIMELAKSYNCEVYVDEAHAFGICGEQGRGVSWPLKPTITIGAFGKAFGTNGAFLAASNRIKNWILNKTNGFIYTTAFSPLLAGATLKSLELLRTMDDERAYLTKISAELRSVISNVNSNLSQSCIIPWLIGTEEKTVQTSEILQENGFKAVAIRPPTVALNTSRIRFSLNSGLKEEEMMRLVQLLEGLIRT